nr:ribonuclease H [Ipomoea batatas]
MLRTVQPIGLDGKCRSSGPSSLSNRRFYGVVLCIDRGVSCATLPGNSLHLFRQCIRPSAFWDNILDVPLRAQDECFGGNDVVLESQTRIPGDVTGLFRLVDEWKYFGLLNLFRAGHASLSLDDVDVGGVRMKRYGWGGIWCFISELAMVSLWIPTIPLSSSDVVVKVDISPYLLLDIISDSLLHWALRSRECRFQSMVSLLSLLFHFISDCWGVELSLFTAWSRLWKSRFPPKVLNFIWRCARAILPTRMILLGRGVMIDVECPLCHSHPETPLHLFRQCIQTSAFWDNILDVPERCCLESQTMDSRRCDEACLPSGG